jgi:hypothetical protein
MSTAHSSSRPAADRPWAAVRVSFDTNAWERVFTHDDGAHAAVREALGSQKIFGFICEAAFRIEAVGRAARASYFAQPFTQFRWEGVKVVEGTSMMHYSFGPDDTRHPGLPPVQQFKLTRAISGGVQLMEGMHWMGLPAPQEILDRGIFVLETPNERLQREQSQLDVFQAICTRGLGYAAFANAGGWRARPSTPAAEKALIKACAEWADGELVAAHIAYRHDVLCTNDRARSAGTSIFDAGNRSWLLKGFGISVMTLDELRAELAG